MGSFEVTEAARPYFWLSLAQDPTPELTVVLKAGPGTEAASLIGPLRDAVELREGEQPAVLPQTFESLMAFDLLIPRIASKALAWGGSFGLFLATLGIYGIVSFLVAQRTREIGLRMALGADAARLRNMVLGHVGRITLAGGGIGLVAAD